MIPGTIRTCFPHLHPQQLSFYFSAAKCCHRVHIRQGNLNFFKSGNSGKNEILQKCLGILHFNLMKQEFLVPMYSFFFFFFFFFFAKFIKFSATILSGKFEFVS